jgi:predicted nucleic acid-binding protein
MTAKYLFDTSIWVDIYLNRKGYNGEPLGDYGFKLLMMIKTRKDTIIMTDFIMRELEVALSMEEIKGMLKPFEDILDSAKISEEQRQESKRIAIERDVPPGDALHAIIARDYKFILITRDKHFRKLNDISLSYKPEYLI